MVAVIEHQRPAAGLGAVLAPCLRSSRHLPGARPATGIALDADGQRRADGAGVDQRLGLGYRRIKDEVLEHPERHPGLHGAGDQPVGALQGGGHRLLQRDRLAGRERRQRRLHVQVVRQQDLHQVDPVQRQQLVVVGGDHRLLHSPRPPAGLGQGRVAVAQGHDGRVRVAQVLDRMQVGDATSADKADSNADQRQASVTRNVPHFGTSPLSARRFLQLKCFADRLLQVSSNSLEAE